MLYAKFRIEKHCLLKHFAFLINVCNQYLIFLHQVTYCFFRSCYLASNKFSMNVLLSSCNTFGQLFLDGHSYSSHTVIPEDIVN